MGHQINASPNDIFQIRPDTDTVEIRMITNPEHPEYDPRVELPVDEELVLDLDKRGMLQPARGYKLKKKNDAGQDVVVLTVGRQRWKAVQEVWRRRREEGRDLKSAPAFRLLITAAQSVAARRGEQIAENRHRQALEGLPLAQSLRAWLDLVGDDEAALEDARVTFNFKSIAALNNCLALLDTTPAVQAALLDGTLSPTAGLQLSRQPEEIQNQAVEVLRSEAEGGIDSENQETAEHDNGNDGNESEDEEGEERPAPRGAPEAAAPAPAKKSASVSRVKEVITNLTGGKSFEMVSLKQVEKQIERKEAELEKAKTRLEQCPTSMHDNNYQKTVNQAARVAEIQGEIKALRWARGENAASGSDAPLQGNDKMSAAWEALREAITSAPWPKVLREKDFEWPELPAWSEDASIQEARSAAFATRREYNERIAESLLLVIAGEKVARREVDSQGKTYNILIDADSKWFTRLMDPFGKPSQLVREWGAHGFLEPQGKAATTPTYRMGCSALCKGRTAIQITRGDSLAKWLEGTALAFVAPSVSEVVRKVIGTLFPERHIHHGIQFHAPYLEEGDGPDLNETLEARKEICSLIEEELEIELEEGDATWTTVGEMVAAIEQAGVVCLGANESLSTDDDEERTCPECGSTNLSGFVAGDKHGNATSTGFVCDDCDTSFDPAGDAQGDEAGQDGGA